MANLKKWISPVTTPVRIEQAYKDLAEALGIQYTEAVNSGLEILIEDRLTNIADPRVTPEMVAVYRKVKNHHLQELELVLHRRVILDEKAKDLDQKRVQVAQERKDLLASAFKVWDNCDEVHKMVLPAGSPSLPGMEIFDSRVHTKVRQRGSA